MLHEEGCHVNLLKWPTRGRQGEYCYGAQAHAQLAQSRKISRISGVVLHESAQTHTHRKLDFIYSRCRAA